MKVCRFDEDRVGVVRNGRVFDVTDPTSAATWPEVVALAMAMAPAVIERCPAKDLAAVRLLPPVRAPGKIIAAPVNYEDHVREMAAAQVSPGHDLTDIKRVGLFLKAPSSLSGPAEGIRLRFPDRRTDHEVELVAVIGRRAENVAPERALEHVAGYCLGLDITLRGAEDRSWRMDGEYLRASVPKLTCSRDPHSFTTPFRSGRSANDRRNPSASSAPRALMRSISFCVRRSSVTRPAAMVMRLPLNVPEWWRWSGERGSKTSITSARPPKAPTGRPPPMILPIVVRSGRTPRTS